MPLRPQLHQEEKSIHTVLVHNLSVTCLSYLQNKQHKHINIDNINWQSTASGHIVTLHDKVAHVVIFNYMKLPRNHKIVRIKFSSYQN